jgi:hypothetical protein
MVFEAVYLGFIIGNLVLTTVFRFQVSAFSSSAPPTAATQWSRPATASFLLDPPALRCILGSLGKFQKS